MENIHLILQSTLSDDPNRAFFQSKIGPIISKKDVKGSFHEVVSFAIGCDMVSK
jgi:hypothetical protein